YKKALAIDTKALGNSNPALVRILDGLAKVSTRQNQSDAAELFRKQAESIRNELGGSKEIVALPMDYDAFTRIKLYSQGARDMDLSVDTVKASAKIILSPSADKERINRPIKDKWALVIGISKFKDPTINLQYASKDAKDFAN